MYAGLAETMRGQPDWARATADTVEPERRAALPASSLAERQTWRDRRLMALRAHKRAADRDLGR